VVAQAAAQVAGDQIKALEQQVLQALAEARRQQDQLGQLQHRLAAAESANRWLPWLLLGLVGAGALALWLALRVRRLLREQARQAWATGPGGEAEAAPATGATALLSPDQPLLSRVGDLAGAGQAAATQPSLTVAHPMVAAVAAAAGSPPERSLPASDFALGSGVPPRPVSVEELLDLDQQADFFLVLGQEQAAVDLLLSHVRSTGGTSALPYFKLLEIYRQQGEEEAYERTRERFNQRFNAFAPDWSGDLAAGRGLEDYVDVIERLQRAWPQPLRTVAELESLLLRRADLEPFDMPAYRDVLMLHALVRDLPASPVAGRRPPSLRRRPSSAWTWARASTCCCRWARVSSRWTSPCRGRIWPSVSVPSRCWRIGSSAARLKARWPTPAWPRPAAWRWARRWSGCLTTRWRRFASTWT